MVKIIIAGATSNCGTQVLLQCLRLPHVEKVLALARRPLPSELDHHKKLKTIIMNDFTDYSEVLKHADGFNACIWCIGGRAKDFKSVEEYITVSHTYTLAAAQSFAALATPSHKFRFIFLSTWGADITEKKWRPLDKTSMYIKGRVEYDLVILAQEHIPQYSFELYAFRPGKRSTPAAPGTEKINAQNPQQKSVSDKLLNILEPTCPDNLLAAALIGVAIEGYGDEGVNVFFENREILEVGGLWEKRLEHEVKKWQKRTAGVETTAGRRRGEGRG